MPATNKRRCVEKEKFGIARYGTKQRICNLRFNTAKMRQELSGKGRSLPKSLEHYIKNRFQMRLWRKNRLRRKHDAAVKTIFAFFGKGKNIADIDVMDVDDFIAEMKKQTKSFDDSGVSSAAVSCIQGSEKSESYIAKSGRRRKNPNHKSNGKNSVHGGRIFHK